jgi:hypothetical protein
MDLTVRRRQQDPTPRCRCYRCPCSRQDSADFDTNRPAESTAYGHPARTDLAAGKPPPESDHRPDGNNGRGHHGATAPGVFPARTSRRSTRRPVVSRRNASPTAPTPEGQKKKKKKKRCPRALYFRKRQHQIGRCLVDNKYKNIYMVGSIA